MENLGLTEFKFIVGHDVKRLVSLHVDNLAFNYVTYVKLGQSLRFINAETIPNAVVEVSTHTIAFCLDHHNNVSSLLEFGVSYFIGLRLCAVRECAKIQTIIASMELSDAMFPIPKHLSISYLSKLTMICEEMIPLGRFAKLRALTEYICHNCILFLQAAYSSFSLI